MAAEAEAAREAKAKIIRSEAELKATTYITRAAKVLNESSDGMQLRYLQVRLRPRDRSPTEQVLNWSDFSSITPFYSVKLVATHPCSSQEKGCKCILEICKTHTQ